MQGRLSTRTDDEKIRVLRVMLENVVNNIDDGAESPDETGDLDYRQRRQEMRFTMKKVEEVFILVARHFCFYCAIKLHGKQITCLQTIPKLKLQ